MRNGQTVPCLVGFAVEIVELFHGSSVMHNFCMFGMLKNLCEVLLDIHRCVAQLMQVVLSLVSGRCDSVR